MREVFISDAVMNKVSDLRIHLVEQLKLSRKAANQRADRIDGFLLSLANAADFPLCRFRKWQALGYRCVVFEKNWVFAYEIFEHGIIVRDMSHTSLLAE
jgi:hypothetical protein